MPGPAAVQKATLDKYIEAWKEWTPEATTATWSETITYKPLPLSLDKPPRTRQQLEPRWKMLVENLKNFKVTIRNVVHDAAQGKAAIYATMTADTDFDSPYINEQTCFLWFDESGEHIQAIEEMNDTAFRKVWDPTYYKHIGFGVPPTASTPGIPPTKLPFAPLTNPVSGKVSI